MFSGAVAGLRNPRATRLIKDDPERALEFIAFVSLLASYSKARKNNRRRRCRALTGVMLRLPRPNWSCPLPQPLVIPDVITLKTLADVRELMRHLPEDRRARSTWRQVATDIEAAAAGGDIVGAVIGLRLVLMLEGVECRPE